MDQLISLEPHRYGFAPFPTSTFDCERAVLYFETPQCVGEVVYLLYDGVLYRRHESSTQTIRQNLSLERTNRWLIFTDPQVDFIAANGDVKTLALRGAYETFSEKSGDCLWPY